MKINIPAYFTSMTILFVCSSTLYAAPPQQPPQQHNFEDLCRGKAIGTKVSNKQGDKTIKGTCELGLKPNHHPMNGENRPPKPQQGPQGGARPPMPNPCQGKRIGDTVTLNQKDKNMTGKCEIRFRPDMPKA